MTGYLEINNEIVQVNVIRTFYIDGDPVAYWVVPENETTIYETTERPVPDLSYFCGGSFVPMSS